MIIETKKYILDHWENLLPNRVKAKELSFVILSQPHGKKRKYSRVVVPFVEPQENYPVVVAKFLRDKAAGALLKNEFSVHQSIFSNNSDIIPKPLAVIKVRDNYVSLESGQKGKTLGTQIRNIKNILGEDRLSKQANAHFELAGDLLCKIRKFEVPSLEDAFCDKDEVLTILRGYLEYGDMSDNEEVFIKRLINSDFLRVIQSEKKVFTHGDFTPGNILTYDGEVKVIDWEFARYSYFGLLDPIRFAFYYFYSCFELGIFSDLSIIESFDKVFLSSKHWLGEEIDRFYDRFAVLNDKGYRKQVLLVFIMHEFLLQERVTEFFGRETKLLLVGLINYLSGCCQSPQAFFGQTGNGCVTTSQKAVAFYEKLVRDKDEQLEENKNYIEKCHFTIREKDDQLRENDKYIQKCHETIQEKDKQLTDNSLYIDKCHKTINQKDKQLEEYRADVKKKESQLSKLPKLLKWIYNLE